MILTLSEVELGVTQEGNSKNNKTLEEIGSRNKPFSPKLLDVLRLKMMGLEPNEQVRLHLKLVTQNQKST